MNMTYLNKYKLILITGVFLILGLIAFILYHQLYVQNDVPITIRLQSDSAGNLVKIYINDKEYDDLTSGFQEMQLLHKELYDKINAKEWVPFAYREFPLGKPNVVIFMDPQLKYKHLWTVIACFTEYIQPNEYVEIPFDKSKVIVKDTKWKGVYELNNQLKYIETDTATFIFKLVLITDGRETGDSVILPIRTEPELVDVNNNYIDSDSQCTLWASHWLTCRLATDDQGRIHPGPDFKSLDDAWKSLKKGIHPEQTDSYDRFDMYVICHTEMSCKSFMSFWLSAKKCDAMHIINLVLLKYPNEKTNESLIKYSSGFLNN
jgi:hypothetical protein